jgi:alpha-mannosidase
MPRLVDHSSAARNLPGDFLDRLREHVYTPIADLSIEAWVTPEPLPFEQRTKGKHRTQRAGQTWGTLFDCAWFHFTGAVPEGARGKHVVLLLDVGGEMCVFNESGVPTQGLTDMKTSFQTDVGGGGKRVVELQKRGTPGSSISVWSDAGCNDLFGFLKDKGRICEACVAVQNDALFAFYYDYEVLVYMLRVVPEDSPRHRKIRRALLDVAASMSTISESGSAAARKVLAPHLSRRGGYPDLSISAIGHCHLDLAWMWPIRETKRKGARSFATALQLMKQYPDYHFGASQPQLYQWIKEDHPALYRQVRKRIVEGRWEVQGAMWVEADTNISSGEALVRQVLHGKRFFRREFGVDVNYLWLPDVFGYSAALPQILREAGVQYFMTQKLSWNKVNRFPHQSFRWRGIDGSEVLAHTPPENTYNSPACPHHLAKLAREYVDGDVSSHALMLFGVGDGGGGPGVEHLERLSRLRNLAGCPPCRQEPAAQFFKKWQKEAGRFATWQGELFLECHTGTYTTHGWMKRYNRLLENRLFEAEWLRAWTAQVCDVPYPKDVFDRIWEEFLLYQFHDILPGSSIRRVYDECFARCDELLSLLDELILEAVLRLGERVPTPEGKASLVLNPAPVPREEWVRLPGGWRHLSLPPLGYKVIAHADTGAAQTQVAAQDTLENDLLRIRFTPDGQIESIYDKETHRELLQKGCPGNDLVVYADAGDAWDLKPDYRDARPDRPTLISAKARSDGPVSMMEQAYRFGSSTLEQRISLLQHSRRITFETRGVWKSPETMLRVAFPVAVHAEKATYDIQFGTLERPTHDNTTWDVAKDEMPAQQWADLSEPDYGVALLNDGKYGYRVKDSILELTLLRSVPYPRFNSRDNPKTRNGFDHRYTDQRDFAFTYALFPHRGDWRTACVDAEAAALNLPLRIAPCSGSLEALPATDASFVDTGKTNVCVSAIKRAEDNDDIIVRLHESEGRRTVARVRLGFEVRAAERVDLMEEKPRAVRVNNNTVRLAFRPFQILTLRLKALLN